MKLLIINGSPKCDKSNTLNIANAFASGFPEDTEIEKINIYQKNIKPCMGCFSCWSKTQRECIIKDDMQEIYKEINSADVIVESFPLYFFGMPSQMKAMTDRCLPYMLPYEGNQVEGKFFHELRDKSMLNKRLVLISTCGYVDADLMYPALLKEYDLICGVGGYTAILCPEGELFIAEKAKRQREGYLHDVKNAGEEFAKNLSLSDETKKLLSRKILSPNGFEAMTRAHWALKSK